MDQPSLSKELTRVRSKPTLMKLDDGQYMSTDRKWHPDLAVKYVHTCGRDRWIPIGELAKVFAGANVPRNKKLVRRRLARLSRDMLATHELLVREIDPRSRRVMAVKLYDPRSEQERQGIHDQLDRLHNRKELSEGDYQLSLCLVRQKDATLQEEITLS